MISFQIVSTRPRDWVSSDPPSSTGQPNFISAENFLIIMSKILVTFKDKNFKDRDLPGGAVVKTPHSQCRGPGFDPWSGNYIPHACCN